MELSLPPLVSSLSLTVTSRLLHPYSTDDKTVRLMVKQFSTARDHPERFTELHRAKDKGDRGDQEEKRGVKREEGNLASNQFTKRSPERVTELSREEKEEKEDRRDLREKR